MAQCRNRLLTFVVQCLCPAAAERMGQGRAIGLKMKPADDRGNNRKKSVSWCIAEGQLRLPL